VLLYSSVLVLVYSSIFCVLRIIEEVCTNEVIENMIYEIKNK